MELKPAFCTTALDVMELKPGTKVARQQCATCPFRHQSDGGLALSAEKMTEVYIYLLGGTNHLCHSDRDDSTICRGGRNYQLTIWHRLGWIASPTDEALAEAIVTAGQTQQESAT